MSEGSTEPGFTIETDPPLNMVRVRLWGGLWDVALIDRFAGELEAAAVAVAAASGSAGGPLCFIDAREHQVQAQNVVGHFQAKLAHVAEINSRTAVVIERALHRLQANRTTLTNQRVFPSVAGAMDWLLSPPSAEVA